MNHTSSNVLNSQVSKFLLQRNGHRFLGGDEPSVADVEAYGVVNLTEGTSAFPEFEKNPEFYQWYKSVEHHVTTHQGMSTSDSESAIEPESVIESELAIAPDSAIEPEAVIEPDTAIESEAAVERASPIELELAVEPESVLEVAAAIEPELVMELEPAVEPESAKEPNTS